jgi:hypothetical protein
LALVGFDCGKTLVEGEGLLDEFEPLNDILVANPTGLFDKIQALSNNSNLSPHFAQLWSEEILQYLTSFFDDTHENHLACLDSTPGSVASDVEMRAARQSLHPAPRPATLGVDTQTIVILDFGSQYTQLIARRIRELNVFSVVLPCTAPLSEIQAYKPLGISPVRRAVVGLRRGRAGCRRGVLELGVPVLGICYGLHFIVHHLGGKVLSAPRREYGHAEVTIEDTRNAAVCGAAGDDPGLDEPRRRSAGAACGLPANRVERQCAGGDCQRGPPHLGGAVPSRGASHAAGSATHPELCLFEFAERQGTGRRRTLSRPPCRQSGKRSARIT